MMTPYALFTELAQFQDEAAAQLRAQHGLAGEYLP
jgi:hypothetical protein